MSQAPPAWQGYVFKLAAAIAQGESTAKEQAGVLHQLPELLSTVASPLEIARRTQTTRTKVSELLSELSEYRVVRVSSTGTGSPFTELYSLTSEGSQFFSQLESLLSTTKS